MNNHEINKPEFWERYPDVFLLPIDNYHYLSAFEAGAILEDFNLTFTDEIYKCEKTRLIFTTITSNGLPPKIECALTLFLPMELLTSYLEY